jgi:release factor glutamine methyltransferase
VTTTAHHGGEPGLTVRRLTTSVAEVVHSEPEARWIVAQAAGLSPGSLLSVFDTAVTEETSEAAHLMARRRAGGEPLQYILGTWSFRQLEVLVDRRALVPRPETEQVVEVALAEIRRRASGPGAVSPQPMVVTDLGTGSGVIALSVALEMGDSVAAVWATDASPAALDLAGDNLAILAHSHPPAAARVHLAQGSWFDALPEGLMGQLQVVVSNPPYVSAQEWSGLDPVVRDYEPHSALVPGVTGLEAFEILISQAHRWLVPGGGLVLEMAPHQAATLTTMAHGAGYGDVTVLGDLSGRPRVLVATSAHV